MPEGICMKKLVGLAQLLIIMVMAYPVIYVWETSKIEQLCGQIQPGMTRDALLNLMANTQLNIQTPQLDHAESSRWTARILSRISFRGFHCEIRGSANQVAAAKILKRAEH